MSSANLFWWILRTRLSVPVKLTLFAMALHGRGLDSIWPSLGRVGHFRSRTTRMIREHVTELVTAGLLIPQDARTGGHAHSTRYTIGIVALDQHVDRSLPEPETIISPKILKAILYADLKPHQKVLLWAIAMYDGREVSKEQLARTLSRSTEPASVQQLRRDIAKLADAGLVSRTTRPGRGHGMVCQVETAALLAIAMPAPPNHGYQLPGKSPLPFPQTTGTDRTQTAGTDRTETTGTNFLQSGTSIGSGDFPRTGSSDRKNLTEVIAGDDRPVHAVENEAPASPLADRRAVRSTGWRRAGSLIYDTLRSECYQQLKLAGERGGRLDRSELTTFARSWCARQGVHHFALPGRRPESSRDLVARVVEDAIFLFEASQRTLKRGAGSSGGGPREL